MPDLAVETRVSLTGQEVAAVHALAAAADTADGVRPLGEQTLLRLRTDRNDVPPGPTRHLLLRTTPDPGASSHEPTLAGYAQLTGVGEDHPVAELVVHPTLRRHGCGRALVAALRAHTPAGGSGVRLWAHGDLPAARALACALGLRPVRQLWRMERPMTGAIPPVRLPEGIRLRPFRPGADDHAWLRLNARAFADHPEQGRWTQADLRDRIREPWFDPAGFLLAERVDEPEVGPVPLGFDWTKVEDGDPASTGEIYVVGVDPTARGLGLGRTLVLAGLHHLRTRGVRRVGLYTEGDNHAAIALYRGLGFERCGIDVMYRVDS